MAVFYHCSCVAPSLVKIAIPQQTPPCRWRHLARRGGEKRPGFGRGPGWTMLSIRMKTKIKLIHLTISPRPHWQLTEPTPNQTITRDTAKHVDLPPTALSASHPQIKEKTSPPPTLNEHSHQTITPYQQCSTEVVI